MWTTCCGVVCGEPSSKGGSMHIRNGKDFWAGLMFLALGLGFAGVAWKNYNMGTAVRMGPAYFPVVLGGLLAVLGAWVFFKSFRSGQESSLRAVQFRPVLLIGAVIAGVACWAMKGQNEIVYQLLMAITYILIQASFGTPALYIVLAAVIVFAFLMKPIGLLLATAVLTVIARAGGEDFKWSDQPKAVAFGLVMYGVFAGLMATLSGAIGTGKAGAASLVIIVAISILSGRKVKGIEIGALFAILGVFSVVIFGHGLGLPFNACPEVMDEACRKIGLGS
jgi:hypothetical protein